MGRLFFRLSAVFGVVLLIVAMAMTAIAAEILIDTDGDLVDDAVDVCPALFDPYQNDADGDGVGDLCDPEPASPGGVVLLGDDSDNTLAGGDGDDALYGMAGDDVLVGGPGDDFLDGGPGNNTLTGGPGNNTYAFDPSGSQNLTITDFDDDLDAIVFPPVDDDPSDDPVPVVTFGGTETLVITFESGATITFPGVTAGTAITFPRSPRTPSSVGSAAAPIAVSYFIDADLDGFGSTTVVLGGAVPAAGQVLDNTDCDDADPSVFPGAVDIWHDGIDSNCDGANDFDQDGDTYVKASDPGEAGGTAPNTGDCADGDAAINPGVADAWYDGVDSDCDGANDFDQDGDTYVATAHNAQAGGTAPNGSDCADGDVAINPGVADAWYDGVDSDCDGANDFDQDGDTYVATAHNAQAGGTAPNGSDCADTTASRNPGAAEVADDGIDQDCDGSDAVTYFADVDVDGFGDPGSSVVSEVGAPGGHVADNTDCDDASSSVYPGAAEILDDGIDQDCDGSDTMSPAGAAGAAALAACPGLNPVNGAGLTTVGTGGNDCITDSGPATAIWPLRLVYGDANTLTFSGVGGDDVIFGGDNTGARLLGDSHWLNGAGQGGDDVIFGGASGDYEISGDANNLVATAKGGNDELYGGAGNDTIHGDANSLQGLNIGGDDILDGGEGDDVLNGEGTYAFNAGTQAGDDTLTGGPGDDVLTGDVGLNGVIGVPTVSPIGGSDTFVFDVSTQFSTAAGDEIKDAGVSSIGVVEDTVRFEGVPEDGNNPGLGLDDLETIVTVVDDGTDVTVTVDATGANVEIENIGVAPGAAGIDTVVELNATVQIAVEVTS